MCGERRVLDKFGPRLPCRCHSHTGRDVDSRSGGRGRLQRAGERGRPHPGGGHVRGAGAPSPGDPPLRRGVALLRDVEWPSPCANIDVNVDVDIDIDIDISIGDSIDSVDISVDVSVGEGCGGGSRIQQSADGGQESTIAIIN